MYKQNNPIKKKGWGCLGSDPAAPVLAEHWSPGASATPVPSHVLDQLHQGLDPGAVFPEAPSESSEQSELWEKKTWTFVFGLWYVFVYLINMVINC